MTQDSSFYISKVFFKTKENNYIDYVLKYVIQITTVNILFKQKYKWSKYLLLALTSITLILVHKFRLQELHWYHI